MLQRFSIAWEQVAIERDSHFQTRFNDTLIYNRLVFLSSVTILISMFYFQFFVYTQTLCELHLVLASAIGQEMPRNNRGIMPEVLRHLRYSSDRSTRNFRILKDYIRALQYLIQGCCYYFRIQFNT